MPTTPLKRSMTEADRCCWGKMMDIVVVFWNSPIRDSKLKTADKLRYCYNYSYLINILILASLLYSQGLGYTCRRAADIRTQFCTDNRRYQSRKCCQYYAGQSTCKAGFLVQAAVQNVWGGNIHFKPLQDRRHDI